MVLAIKEIPYVTQRYLLVVASGTAMDFPGDLGYDVAMYESYQPINQEHTTPHLKIKAIYLVAQTYYKYSHIPHLFHEIIANKVRNWVDSSSQST